MCDNHEAVIEVEHNPAEVPQDTHYSNGLRKLCNPATVHQHFESIMSEVCKYDFYCEYPPVPERHALLQALPIARAVKRDALKCNPGLKRRSTHGYIWVDHDPMAILANKYIIRSCHLLDNTEYEYRSGNFNHVYNPYMVTLFAGRENPSVEIDAVSPKTDDALCVGGEHQKIRKHQANVNLFLLADEEGKPFLYVSPLKYDSCEETPWAWAIARYCRVYAKRLGIGVCFDSSWEAKIALRPGTTLDRWGSWPENYEQDKYYSPAYSHPVAPRCFPGYHDGALETNSVNTVTGLDKLSSSAYAYKVIEPTTDERLTPAVSYTHASVARGEENSVTCYSCDDRVHSDEALYVDGDYYCQGCYEDEFTYCDGCEEPVREVTELNDSYFCNSCYIDRVTRCERCGDNVPNEEAIEIENDSYCASCVEEYGQTCSRCDEQLIEFTRYRTTVGNVTWHTPPDSAHVVPMCECCDEEATQEEEEAIEEAERAEEERREALGIVDARPASQAEVLPLFQNTYTIPAGVITCGTDRRIGTNA